MAKKKTAEKKGLTPFNILFDMNNGKKLYTKEQLEEAKMSMYLLLTYVSSNVMMVSLANHINRNWKSISLYDAYLFLFISMKDMRISCKWDKRDKKITAKTEDVELLMRYFKVKEEVAIRYTTLFKKEELDYFREIYAVAGSKKLSFQK